MNTSLQNEPVVVIIDDSSDEDTIQMVNSKAQNNEKENIHEKNINQSSAIASSLLSLSAAASMTTTTVIDLSQISTCKEEDTVVISSTTSSCSSSMNKASFSDDLESPPDKCSHVQDKSEQNHELDEQQQQQQRPSKRARLVADTIPFNLFQAQEQELLRFRRMKEQSKQKKDKTNCQKKDEKQKAILPTGINANVPSTSSKTSNDPAVPLEMKRTEPIKDIPTIIEKVTVPSELPTSLLKEESSGKHTEKVRPTFSEAKNVNKVHTKTVKRSRSSTNRVQHPRSENSNVSSNISRKQLSTSIKRCHFSQYIVPSTAWRGNRLKEEAPINLLPNDPSLKLPFAKEYDVPLDVYDPSGLLKDKCAFVSSVKKSDNANLKVETQKEELLIPSAIVEELMQHQLPQIKQCYQRKVSTIVSETRKQVLSYLSASKKQLYLLQQKKLSLEKLAIPREEINLAGKFLEPPRRSFSKFRPIFFSISLGNGSEEEKTMKVNPIHLQKLRCLPHSTTYTGVRSSVQVDDNPVLRYLPYFGDHDNGEAIDIGHYDKTKEEAIANMSTIDDEVKEFFLRFVVHELGESNQVFHALKEVANFKQPLHDYNEMKKTYEAKRNVVTRVEGIKQLQSNKICGYPLTKLLSTSRLYQHASQSRPLTLKERLQAPCTVFYANLLRYRQNDDMGIRDTQDYENLIESYRDLFCRMCYKYDCHEHGIEHPLPSQRYDPMKPPALLSGNNSRGSTDESDQSMQKDASHAHKQHDTNFLQKVKDDDSCFQGAENIMNKLKNKRSCSPGCGKPGAVHNDEHVVFNGSEQMLIQKLMPMMGNNPCILAAALNTRTCSEIYRFLDQEKAKSSKIGIVASEWHLDFPTGASNRPRRLDRETLKRTRTIMAKNVASRVQYQPCNHEGDCDPSNCSCMKRDHCCERACSCSSNCPNRFQGCRCSLGNCRTNACPCFIAARECDPDLCGNCGASDIPLLMQDPNQCTKSASELGICHNVNLLRKIHKKVAMSYSTTHGWGLFACENIKKGEFIYEYTGAMISHDEAERRGTIYDKIQISFLFELNEESVVDATRKGNKWKFANHQTIGPNCKAKTFRLRGEHRIGIWALQDILKNEELFFDYGYNGESAPDWSKIRIRTS